MPVLDRQPVPLRDGGTGSAAPGAAASDRERVVPQHVPETRPTPLQHQYIYLSAIALVCGTIAITALEMGAGLGSLLVKLCVVAGAPPLALAMADATLRIWRSAWAWLPVNRGRAWFRFAWVGAVLILYAVLAIAVIAVLAA